MSDELLEKTPEADELKENSGLNLYALYGCLVLALVTAMAVAAAIVWPFYVRR